MARRTIFKYPLMLTANPQIIGMHKGAVIRHVAEQAGSPTIWVENSAKAEMVSRTFIVVGTGHVIPEGGEYIGTVQLPPFVWHIYEVA